MAEHTAPPRFKIVVGDDIEGYLLTDAPGARKWKLKVHDTLGGPNEAEPAEGWISQYRPLQENEVAWCIGLRHNIPARSVIIRDEGDNPLYHLLIDEEGMLLSDSAGTVLYDETRALSLGCTYCRSAPHDFHERVERMALVIRPHHEFALVTCPECRQVWLEEEIEFVDWQDRWGGHDVWLRWRPLSREREEWVHSVAVAPNPHVRFPWLQGLMHGGRRVLRSPSGEMRWVRGVTDPCDLLPPG
jgi:hypothetical protein